MGLKTTFLNSYLAILRFTTKSTKDKEHKTKQIGKQRMSLCAFSPFVFFVVNLPRRISTPSSFDCGTPIALETFDK
jgi:hypothetical protein